MSRILIVGSHRAKDGDRALFQEICYALGSSLARKGHELLVCSSSPNTADWEGVRGADAAGAPGRPSSVSYFISKDEFTQLEGASPYAVKDFPCTNVQLRVTGHGWFSTYNTATDAADAIIAVGGTPRGTGGAIYITLAKGKPALAIPALGGFAEDVWNDFTTEYAQLPGADQLALTGKKPDEIADAATRSVENLIAKNPFAPAAHGWRYAVMPLVMLIASAWWAYTATVPVAAAWWFVPYTAAFATAVAGMLFRYATDDARKVEAYTGAARIFKDLTRVVGALLGVCLLLKLGAIQVHSKETDSATVLMTWLALGGFTSGFLIEQVTGTLTRTLSAALDAKLSPAR